MRQVSVNILGDSSSAEAVKWIIQAFNNDKSRLVRARAVWALGRKKSGQTKKLLLQSLKDPYNKIRTAAIYGLAKYESPQMIGVFLRIFNEDPDESVRRAAISNLAKYDSPQVVRILFRVFNNYPDFRDTAIKGLTRFESPQVVQLFVRSFDDELFWVRHTAATEFIKLKSPAAGKAAQKLLNHKDPEARDAAKQLLDRLKNKK